MKNKLIYTFLVAILFLGQHMTAQKTRATLVFKDGSKKEGYGKLSGSQSIKYRPDKKGKSEKINFSELESVEIVDGDQTSKYKQVTVQGAKEPKVLEEILTGKVTLYTLISQGFSPGFGGAGGPGGPVFTGGQYYSIKNTYLLRNGATAAEHLGSNQLFSKNFKKATAAFFKDCPELVRKIENKEYKKKEIKAIVEFYNTSCN